eukprot:TRINITY_DN9065_c0_g1_i3.p1 TRINITY_DN9065_c0_g1~~TRINITY_DN9065_c0_g1_i3.p1  ORF type:complete len:373 (+),score=86.08 TRINITY_DN9065_c0_g1_i3:717-1835(+)
MNGKHIDSKGRIVPPPPPGSTVLFIHPKSTGVSLHKRSNSAEVLKPLEQSESTQKPSLRTRTPSPKPPPSQENYASESQDLNPSANPENQTTPTALATKPEDTQIQTPSELRTAPSTRESRIPAPSSKKAIIPPPNESAPNPKSEPQDPSKVETSASSLPPQTSDEQTKKPPRPKSGTSSTTKAQSPSLSTESKRTLVRSSSNPSTTPRSTPLPSSSPQTNPAQNAKPSQRPPSPSRANIKKSDIPKSEPQKSTPEVSTIPSQRKDPIPTQGPGLKRAGSAKDSAVKSGNIPSATKSARPPSPQSSKPKPESSNAKPIVTEKASSNPQVRGQDLSNIQQTETLERESPAAVQKVIEPKYQRAEPTLPGRKRR